MSKVLGIDPGLGGALALLNGDNLVSVMDMPTGMIMVGGKSKRRIIIPPMVAQLKQWKPDMAFVEQVGPMPRQGVTSVFQFGQSFGIILGVLATLQIRYELVPPAKWKKLMRVGREKDESRMRAMEIWPRMSHYFEKKKDDGRAEAALIAKAGQELSIW